MQIWDYHVANNWQPHTNGEREWFLVRKINYGEFKGMKKEMLVKYFDTIKAKIDPGKRAMLEKYLQQ